MHRSTSFLSGWTLAAALAVAPVASAATYYVSPSGDDGHPGTAEQPFATVQRGVDALGAGDTLVLRGGRYAESVHVHGKQGTAQAPITIVGAEGEGASIDGRLALGGAGPTASPAQWVPATVHDPAAHEEEFVSVETFPGPDDLVNRGAFLDVPAHTRLISYARLEDLRAANETWEPMPEPDPARPGPAVVVEPCAPAATDPACRPLPDCAPYPACATQPPNRYRRLPYVYPWAYMGPGLWFDRRTGRVHVRLSHTRNGVPGLEEYRGEVDPRRVRLAVADKRTYALRVEGSRHLRIENVEVRFGGQETIQLAGVADLTFDRVRIDAGTRAVRMGPATRVTFRDCTFDGGLPPWSFRNDLKGEYHFVSEQSGLVELNGRGNTADTLLLGSGQDRDTVVEHSEFLNGHDLYLAGNGFDFHHNWIRNLNDEALFLDAYHLSDARIHHNLVTKSLSGVSFAGQVVGGRRSLYGNVFDLRAPTAGTRPRRPGDRDVWRYGHAFKSNATPTQGDGPHDLFRNTFLVQNQVEHASFLHYEDTRPGGANLRRSLDNIFVAVNAVPEADKPITILPAPAFPARTDGNGYFRFGFATRPAFQHYAYPFQGVDHPVRRYADLDELRGSTYFDHTRQVHGTGHESESREVDPRFVAFSAAGPLPSDDFRLQDTSGLCPAGVALPPDLQALPGAGSGVGACPCGGPELRVGVGGRRLVCTAAPAP
jgi:hypothetical protein